ncbi:MAG: tRNA (guanosine(37)-N1)-methyltransferase TrmD [Patescibacteria group bacterium]|nr:tRNA (guanosine(37)-N1)-methyltransferase TrmD [Patescibacteria group bacterium]
MIFHIITLFPEMFDSYLNESIVARARKSKKITVKFYNPRDFTKDKHRRIDGSPYGGGPGMVMQAEPILRAVQKARGKKKRVKTYLLSPNGKEFTNKVARSLISSYTDIILIAGRYEGVDARVKKILRAEEISVGPYVLTGGELPAMVIIDAVARQIKGVLHAAESVEEERVASAETYTRPETVTFKGKKYKVPKVLLSGNHKKIEEWRKERRSR